MCIYCLITCKCIVHILTQEVNIFVQLEHSVAIYIRPRGVVITLADHVWDVCQ